MGNVAEMGACVWATSAPLHRFFFLERPIPWGRGDGFAVFINYFVRRDHTSDGARGNPNENGKHLCWVFRVKIPATAIAITFPQNTI